MTDLVSIFFIYQSSLLILYKTYWQFQEGCKIKYKNKNKNTAHLCRRNRTILENTQLREHDREHYIVQYLFSPESGKCISWHLFSLQKLDFAVHSLGLATHIWRVSSTRHSRRSPGNFKASFLFLNGRQAEEEIKYKVELFEKHWVTQSICSEWTKRRALILCTL